MEQNGFLQQLTGSNLFYCGNGRFDRRSKGAVLNDAFYLQIGIQFVQQTGLTENVVDFIAELSAHISTVMTSQMMMTKIAVKTTNDYIMDISCKELNEVKQFFEGAD